MLGLSVHFLVNNAIVMNRPLLSFLVRDLKYRYSRATSDEEEPKASPLENSVPDSFVIGHRVAACALLLAALIGALGFGVGQYAFELQRHPSKEQPPANTINFHSERQILRTFGHNRTFASAPSEETDMAWDSLFPSMNFEG